MDHSESFAALAAALALAQLDISNPPLDRENTYFGSRYATLGACLNSVRGPLAKQGISIVQTVSCDPGSVGVTTTLIHSSGEWLASTIVQALGDKSTVQQLGSAVTYLRRYGLTAMTMVVGEADDDGNDASKRTDAPEGRDRPRDRNAPAGRDGHGSTPTASKAMRAPSRTTAAPEHLEPHPAANVPAPAPAPVPAPGKPTAGMSRKWPKMGSDVVTVTKVATRTNGLSALQTEHPEYGPIWLCCTSDLIGAVKLNEPLSVDWHWDAAGYYKATRIGPAPQAAAAPAAVVSVEGADGDPF